MNNKRRKHLREASRLLEEAQFLIQQVLDEEQNALDNIPENLIDGVRAESLSDAIDHLEDCSDEIDEAMESLENAMT